MSVYFVNRTVWGINVMFVNVEVGGTYSYHCDFKKRLTQNISWNEDRFPRCVLHAVDTRGATVYLTQRKGDGKSFISDKTVSSSCFK